LKSKEKLKESATPLPRPAANALHRRRLRSNRMVILIGMNRVRTIDSISALKIEELMPYELKETFSS